MRKFFSLFAALTLSVGLWAAAPANVESVDLGLPSGLKWATFNVGATAPEGNGDYFAWGETEPYYNTPITDPISWKTGKENGYKWQSYCGASDFTEWNTAPYDATTNILKPEFDAATANWGSDWRMPTKAEQDELRAECTWTWTEDYNGTGIKGYIVASKAEGNTNSIFLPASGYRTNSLLYVFGSDGGYWSSSLDKDESCYAYGLYFDSDYVDWDYYGRYYGLPVRPVYVSAAPKVGEQFVDTISGLKFAVASLDPKAVKVIANNYTGTTYTVPAKVSYNGVDFAVTEIEGNAFYNRSSLQSVTLPEGLLTIGGSAFEGCSSLESVTIPASVTTIEEFAFAGSGLQTITIPAGVTEIGEGAFAECAGLTSVTFLGNACQDAIGYLAFMSVGEDSPALLTLPDNWTGSKPDKDGNWYGGKFAVPGPKVGDRFEDATSGLWFEATAVGDTNTVKVIKNNYTATSYIVPDTVKYLDVDFAVTEIGTRAFALCYSLESITIPTSVTTIGGYAFTSCEKLISITIPESVTTIGKDAFSECSSLQSITIPASVTTIGVGAFYECTSLESITLPAGLTTIENEVFNNCEKLQSIIIPADVTTIGEIAFAGSGLQTITIPAGVISLGMGAFAECAGLTSVIFEGNACQDAIGELAFYEVGKDAPALLTLPNSWTGSKPDEDGNWYGGKFELAEDPTTLPQMRAAVKATKVLTNGQVIFRKENKNYTILGQEK